MIAKLISTTSAGEISEYELTGKVTTIGRKSGNDISIDETSVSGQHAAIITRPEGLFLKDLNSTNGTYVNGKPIKIHALRNGDKISLGKFKFIFSSGPSDAEQDSETTVIVRPGELSVENDVNAIKGELLPRPAPIDPIRAQQLEVWQYIAILTRQLPFVLVFTLSSILTALTLTFVASEKYEATTTIFYRPIEVLRLRTQEATAFGSPVPSTAYSVIGQTIEELLQSQLILKRVVDALDLDVVEAEDYSNAPWHLYYYKATKDLLKEYGGILVSYLKYGRIVETDETEDAIDTLGKSIKIAIDESYVSNIIVRDKDKNRAAAIANKLSEELIKWLKEKEISPLKYRKQRLQVALSEVQESIDNNRDSLLSLLKDNKVSSIEYELEQGNIRISKLETSRIDVLANIDNKVTQIKEMEGKLEQNNSGSGPSGEGQIQSDDFKRLTSEDSKRLTSDLLNLSIALAGERSKYEALQNEISILNDRLLALSQLHIEYQRIDGLLDTANRDHLLIKDTLQEVIVREVSIDSEIGILSKAVAPLEPVTPIKIYHTALAGILGMIVSIGLVYLLNFFNIRILFSSAGIAGRRTPVTPSTEQGTLSEVMPLENN